MTAERLFDLLRCLIVGKFYGELLIKFENGAIVVVKKTESMKDDTVKEFLGIK